MLTHKVQTKRNSKALYNKQTSIIYFNQQTLINILPVLELSCNQMVHE